MLRFSGFLFFSVFYDHREKDETMVLKTGPVREPEKGVVPVSVVRPGSDRWSNR
jgi:5-deoxy-D-glucuronate isomerase